MDARKKSLDQLDGKVSLASNEVESGKRDVQNAKKLQDESAEAVHGIRDMPQRLSIL
jgi:hypothetical protein